MPLPSITPTRIQDDVTVLSGGLDQRTPNLRLRPGHVREGYNWECAVQGGYSRVGGYERSAGGILASSATYSVLVFNSFVDHPTTWSGFPDLPTSWQDSIVKGLTSNVQGAVAYYVDASITDLYADQIYLVLRTANLPFQVGETVVVRSYDIAGNENPPCATVGVVTATSLTTPLTPKQNAILLAKAANSARSENLGLIGSGPVLGVFTMIIGGVRKLFGFRNNADGTQAIMWKATGGGAGTWGNGLLNMVDLRREVRFTAGGTAQPAEGTTLTQGGVTATIVRVVQESGSWAGGTAAGRFILGPVGGGNFAAGAATIGAINVTLSGAQTAITLAPNGKYQFVKANFAGQLTSARIYGCDGVNRAFEFDGDVFVPIETKAPVDTPKFIAEHHQHLVLAIGSSLMISGIQAPYKFTAIDGAAEKAVGDDVTGLLVQPGNQDNATLGVFCRNRSGMLYGTSAANWKFVMFTNATGCLPYMAQNLEQSYVLDDRGIMSFAAAQEYGNFSQASISADIDTWILPRKPLVTCSCVSIEKNQYRLFFSDGSALYTTLVNGQVVGSMPQQFLHAFNCVWSAEDASGNEEIFAGALNSGQVYQLDSGSSFDGEPITHQLVLNWNFMKSPRIEKQFHGASLEIQSPFYAEFDLGYQLNYRSPKEFQAAPRTYDTSNVVQSAWDSGILWDSFTWDGATLSPAEVDVHGFGTCLQLIISGEADYVMPFTVNSIITGYSLGRRVL